MVKKLLTNKNGIVVADALVAVLLMTIFLGVISTLCYNIYITANFTKRNSIAMNYGVAILEYIDKVDYESITYNNLISYVNGLDDKISAETEENKDDLSTPYKAVLDIEKYNETAGNTDKQDLIKTITVQIEYNLGDSARTIELERVKQR